MIKDSTAGDNCTLRLIIMLKEGAFAIEEAGMKAREQPPFLLKPDFLNTKSDLSVYGLQNDIRSHSPTHTPVPETKPPTEDELRQEIKYWQIQLDRHRLKMSKVAESLLVYTEQYVEYDPFLAPTLIHLTPGCQMIPLSGN
uniref:Uncharacterized protein n=1 Tax=Sphaerodactylus townsendi TaxID=933632 RepID=A0ACB8GAV1_9SAUR